MDTQTIRRRFARLGATLAVVAAASALTPASAQAASYCGSLAAGAWRATYNATGSAFLAYKAWEFQYYSCRAVEWLTS